MADFCTLIVICYVVGTLLMVQVGVGQTIVPSLSFAMLLALLLMGQVGVGQTIVPSLSFAMLLALLLMGQVGVGQTFMIDTFKDITFYNCVILNMLISLKN